MSEAHDKIMTMVHELEEKYGTLTATPLSSVKLKRLQIYTKSLPAEKKGGHISGDFTLADIQKALDTGKSKRDIARQFNLSQRFICKNVKAGLLNDEKWRRIKKSTGQRRRYEENKERLNKEAKELGL